MPDITPDVRAAIQRVLKQVYYQHPAQLAVFPCAVLYESANAEAARADGSAHLHEIEYTLELWAHTPGETHALSTAADAQLSALGLRRSACTDLYDEPAAAHRRVLRYRALCDENGVLTQ